MENKKEIANIDGARKSAGQAPYVGLGIVIPTVNCARFLTGAIMSIQTAQRYSLIIIDNNSRPEEKEKMKHLRRHKNTTVITNSENVGCAASWNQGIRELLSTFFINHILVMNNDIILHPQCIDLLIKKQKETGHPFVSATDVAKECDTPGRIKGFQLPEKDYITDEPEFSCFMISRQGFGDIGIFDEKFYPAYFEDNDYHYRTRLAGLRAVKYNRALYYHYGSRTIKENEDLANVNDAYYLQNEKYYEAKWGGKPGSEKHKTPFGGRRC